MSAMNQLEELQAMREQCARRCETETLITAGCLGVGEAVAAVRGQIAAAIRRVPIDKQVLNPLLEADALLWWEKVPADKKTGVNTVDIQLGGRWNAPESQWQANGIIIGRHVGETPLNFIVRAFRVVEAIRAGDTPAV